MVICLEQGADLINFIHRKNFDSSINKEKKYKIRKTHAINIQKHAHKQHMAVVIKRICYGMLCYGAADATATHSLLLQ